MPTLQRHTMSTLWSWIALAVLASSSGCCCCSPAGGWWMNNSGMGYYQRGEFAMARYDFSRAVALDPYNPDYRHNLAVVMNRLGDTGQAERILRHNLTVDTMHQPTYHTLAQMMVQSGRSGEAYDLVHTWEATQPYIPESHIEMAWIERETGNVQGAEMALRQALRAEPGNAVALAQLGQLYQDHGQPQQAMAMYQQSLASNTNQPELQTRMAQLQGHSGGVMMAGRGQLPPPVFGGAQGPVMSSAPLMMPSSPAGMMASAPMVAPIPQPQPQPRMTMPPQPRPQMAAPAMVQQGNWAPASRPVPQPMPAPNRAAPIPAGRPTASTATPATPVVSTEWQPTGTTVPGPVLITNPDPAHTTEQPIEMTAALPTVEAH